MSILIDELEFLKGKEIKRFLVDENRHFFVFEVGNHEKYYFYVGGHCCSRGWLESVNNIEALVGHKIVNISAVASSDIPGLDQEDEHGQIYSLKISTDAGYVDIEFRHTHNGYYSIILEYIGKAKDKAELLAKQELEGRHWDYHITDDLDDLPESELKDYKGVYDKE